MMVLSWHRSQVLKAVVGFVPVKVVNVPSLWDLLSVRLFPDCDVLRDVRVLTPFWVRVRNEDIAILARVATLPVGVLLFGQGALGCTALAFAGVATECRPAVDQLSTIDAGLSLPQFPFSFQLITVIALTCLTSLLNSERLEGRAAISTEELALTPFALWPGALTVLPVTLFTAGWTAQGIAAEGTE